MAAAAAAGARLARWAPLSQLLSSSRAGGGGGGDLHILPVGDDAAGGGGGGGHLLVVPHEAKDAELSVYLKRLFVRVVSQVERFGTNPRMLFQVRVCMCVCCVCCVCVFGVCVCVCVCKLLSLPLSRSLSLSLSPHRETTNTQHDQLHIWPGSLIPLTSTLTPDPPPLTLPFSPLLPPPSSLQPKP